MDHPIHANLRLLPPYPLRWPWPKHLQRLEHAMYHVHVDGSGDGGFSTCPSDPVGGRSCHLPCTISVLVVLVERAHARVTIRLIRLHNCFVTNLQKGSLEWLFTFQLTSNHRGDCHGSIRLPTSPKPRWAPMPPFFEREKGGIQPRKCREPTFLVALRLHRSLRKGTVRERTAPCDPCASRRERFAGKRYRF